MKRGSWLLPCLVLVSLSTATAAEIPIAGRVLGPGGSALPGAEVLLIPALDPVGEAHTEDEGRVPDAAAKAKTDAVGQYRLTAPQAGLWRIRVGAPGFVPVEMLLTPLLESTELPDADLVPNAGLTVRVNSRDGGPIAGGRVRLAPARIELPSEIETWRPPVRTAITGKDGVALLPRGEMERGLLTVSAPGYLLQERRNVRGTATTVRLARGTERVLEVRSADGTVAAGVLVVTGESDHPVGYTDDKGLLKVAVPPKGQTSLSLIAQDGRRVTGAISKPSKEGEGPRRFALPKLVTVTGRIIDAESRRPLAASLVWEETRPWAAASSDPTGQFVLNAPGGRILAIVAGATGYLPFEGRVARTVSTEDPGPTLALHPATAIEGIVVDADDKPIAGAKVTLEPKRPGGGMVIVIGRPGKTLAALTSSKGRFRLNAVDPSKGYDLEARAAGFAPALREVLGLDPRKTLTGMRVELTPGRKVVGRVVDGDGRPVREADAQLRPARRSRGPGGVIPFTTGGPPPEGIGGSSNDEGRFTLSGLGVGTFDLEVRRAGFAKKSVPGIEVTERAEPVDLGNVTLEPGERVQGLVTDPAGGPIEGVEVSLVQGGGRMMLLDRGPRPSQPDAVTGPDGWFAVENLGRGETINLSFSRKGFLENKQTGVNVPRAEPLAVVLHPSSRVSGAVLDPDEKPIPGAEVFLTRTESGGIGGAVFKMMRRESATADDQGRFVFENVNPGTISLAASAAGWQEAKIDALEVPKGSDLEGVRLPLKPGASIEGRVLAPDGRPAIGARVRSVSEDDEPIRVGGLTTDGDGRYRLEGIAPGRVSIEATHDDYMRTVKDLDARPGVNVLQLQFEGGQEVAGIVTSSSGQPIPGAWIRLTARGRDWGGPEAISGPDGSFKMEGLGDGDYSLWAGRDGYAPTGGDPSVRIAGQPVRDLRVELKPGGTIIGTVTGLDREKLGQVEVRAFRPQGEGAASSGVDREGGFRLVDLAPGPWTVIGSLPSTGQQARGTVSVEAGAAGARVQLQFGQGLTLSGRAVHGQSPVKDAVIFAQGTDVNHSGTGRSDSDGRFSVQGLEPGTYRVDLRQWDTGLSFSKTVEVKSSREVLLEIPTARMVGHVLDAVDRQPLAGATVSLSPPAGGQGPGFLTDRGATSDLNGRFEVANLADGEWRLSLSKRGYAAKSSQLTVQNGRGDEDFRISLDPTEGLALDVRLPSGRTPDEVSIVVLDAGGRSLCNGTFSTGENGRVRLSSVPPGSWELLASAGGSGTANLRVEAPGPPIVVALPPACALKLTVPDLTGSPVAATARLSGADGRPFRSLGWFSDPVAEWRLSGGELQLDTLPPGTWTVEVAATDGRTWRGSCTTSPGTLSSAVLR